MTKHMMAFALAAAVAMPSAAFAAPILNSCELFVQQSAGKSQAAIDDGIRQIVVDLATQASAPGANKLLIKKEIGACSKLVANADLAVQIQQIALAITKKGTETGDIGGSASPN